MYNTIKTVLSALVLFVLATSCEKAFEAFPFITIPSYNTPSDNSSSEDGSASTDCGDATSSSSAASEDSTFFHSLEGQLWARTKTYHMVLGPKGEKEVRYTYRCLSFDSGTDYCEFELYLPKDAPLPCGEPVEGTLKRGKYSLEGNHISFSGTSLDSGFIEGNNMSICEWTADIGHSPLIATTLTLYTDE